LEQRINQLIRRLQERRCLLVLDNLETLLEEGDPEGNYCAGYQGYGRLIERLGESAHRSCVVLTSREKPREIEALEGLRGPVRSLRLSGLSQEAARSLLQDKDLRGDSAAWLQLIASYAGNPLALKIVGQTIVDLFAGDLVPFLHSEELIFNGIRVVLRQQVARLTPLEQTLLTWLAVTREWTSLDALLSLLVKRPTRARVLEALEALWRRSLIERGQGASFTLQSVVMEYVTDALLNHLSEEIRTMALDHLQQFALEQAQAKDYVRQTQVRLLVRPLVERLRAELGADGLFEAHLLRLLSQFRAEDTATQGYGPANVISVLKELRGHLRGLDLSQLAIRGAYLQGVEMQDASLAGATLRDSTFTKTFDATWSVDISGSGTYWAVGSERGKVRVWREGGRLLDLAWQAHTNTVKSLAFSPDERMFATSSWDGAIKLWDLEYGALLWTGWQTSSIQRLAFAPDGRTLASGGDDAVIRLWDAHSGTLLQTLTGHSGPVHALAWSPNGRLLASAGFDQHIRLWDSPQAQPETSVQVLVGHTNLVLGLAFAPDGRTLASASWDRTVKLWDMESHRLRETLTGHTDKVLAVLWSPDGRLVATCGLDRTIWLWDVERSSYRTTLYGHTAGVYAIAFTPDNRSLLSGSEDGTVRVWEVERGQCVQIMQGYAVSVYDVAWSPDGTQLASAGTNQLVTLWDVEALTPSSALRGHSWNVYGVTWSPDGRRLASSGWDNAIRVWDANAGESWQTLRDPDYVDTLFYGVAWSPDGKLLATGSYQRGVQVWEMTTSTRLWIGRGQPTKIRRVAWSPDSSQLASCGDDGSICLWKASDGTLLEKLQEHRGIVASVAWSSDGARLASCGGGMGSGELFVWDARSGERLYSLSEPSEILYALTWSRSGTMLVSGNSDGMLRWWDLQRGECVRVRKAHQGAIQSLKSSPDGQRLASCGDDGAINVWEWESGEHLRTLRRDRPYERLDIGGVQGLTDAQRATLQALGAIEDGKVARL